MDDAMTLARAGVKEGAKMMMVGVSRDERQKVESLAVPKPLYELRNPQGTAHLSLSLTCALQADHRAALCTDRVYKEQEAGPKKKRRFHYLNTLPLPRSEVLPPCLSPPLLLCIISIVLIVCTRSRL
jgi:hypothetical protein